MGGRCRFRGWILLYFLIYISRVVGFQLCARGPFSFSSIGHAKNRVRPWSGSTGIAMSDKAEDAKAKLLQKIERAELSPEVSISLALL